MTINVLLADRDEDERASFVAAAARRRVAICGEVASAQAAVELARELQPDVVVVGGTLEDCRGLEALPLLAEAAPAAILLMYGNLYGPRGEAAALTAGAHAYFTRVFDAPDDVMSAIADLPLGGADQAQPAS